MSIDGTDRETCTGCTLIGQAKRLGYILGEILQILKNAERERTPCPRVRLILERRIKENRKQLKDLMALQWRMEQTL